jgi:hypothetical protein
MNADRLPSSRRSSGFFEAPIDVLQRADSFGRGVRIGWMGLVAFTCTIAFTGCDLHANRLGKDAQDRSQTDGKIEEIQHQLDRIETALAAVTTAPKPVGAKEISDLVKADLKKDIDESVRAALAASAVTRPVPGPGSRAGTDADTEVTFRQYNGQPKRDAGQR